MSGRRGSNPPPIAWKAIALPNELLPLFVKSHNGFININPAHKRSKKIVGGGGFEPPKAAPTDLQSAPFDRSGIPPE